MAEEALMDSILIPQTNKQLSVGAADHLGATLSADGINFAIFSQYAKEVYLLLFDSPDGQPTDTIKIENKTNNIWHVFVHGTKAGQLYAYKANGDYNPQQGLRFNPHKCLLDPYAKALTGSYHGQDGLLYPYDLNAPEKDLVMDQRDNTAIVPKAIVVDDAFDWQNDKKPQIARKDLLIYEAHLKGMTAHPSAHVKNPGTYLGFIEKIPYLKELGINAVELLPIQEFYVQDYLTEKGLTNYWGYDTIGFFAPSFTYSTKKSPGCQIQEFKTLVREMHKAGLEVILDVVYNHTAEGNELGPTISFKGIDNPTYYYLMQNTPEEPYRHYKNDTGCGNTFNVENPATLRLILDSLRYWVDVMHVDGFRFDLATVLGRPQGEFNKEAAFFAAIAQDPILKDAKMIAEPWDLTTYQVGGFPKGWMEWNGKFRDTVRRFIKSDENEAPELTKRFTGSRDIYEPAGRDFYETVNFVTCHDGFTLNDVFSYNEKHNEQNKEDNKDGSNDNNSWDCGVEGATEDPEILNLRKQMVKNALCLLLFSSGTPMILSGDEWMRTQNGNNNAWCQDNEVSWLNWELMHKNAEILNFFKKAVIFRKQHPLINYSEYKEGQPQLPHISWFDRKLQQPAWDNSKLRTLCFQLKQPDPSSPSPEDSLFFILNMYHRGSVVHLPQQEGYQWCQIVNTANKAGDDFRLPGKEKRLRRQARQYCAPRSIMVLVGKRV